jgi:hypothetical protein
MNDAELDRMVDGELSPRQQRELLGRLEDEPGGWRRLALAFVEARAWRTELAGLAQATGHLVNGPRPSADPARGLTWRRMLTIAAGLAIAFGLGFLFRHPPARTLDQNPIAAPPTPPAIERELVRMVGDGTVDLPVVEATQVSPDWVRSRPSLVPPSVRHELESSGHRIEQRRVFLPLILENGQPAVVPIDEAEVQFVGERFVQ